MTKYFYTSKYLVKIVRYISKPVSMAILGTILLTNIANDAQSQVIDTTKVYGHGQIEFANSENMNAAHYINVTFRPTDSTAMGEIPFDTLAIYQAGNNGLIEFNLPVFLDTTYTDTTNNIIINPVLMQDVHMFPNNGNDYNIFFPRPITGVSSVVNMAGQIVEQQSFQGDQIYNNLGNLAKGAYIIQVTSDDGKIFREKFIKDSENIAGSGSRLTLVLPLIITVLHQIKV